MSNIAVPSQSANKSLEETLFSNRNNEQLCNIKFFVESGRAAVTPDDLAQAVVLFVNNRREKANGTIVHSSFPDKVTRPGSVQEFFQAL